MADNFYGYVLDPSPALLRVREDGRVLGVRAWDPEAHTLALMEEQPDNQEPYRGGLWVSKYQALRELQQLSK